MAFNPINMGAIVSRMGHAAGGGSSPSGGGNSQGALGWGPGVNIEDITQQVDAAFQTGPLKVFSGYFAGIAECFKPLVELGHLGIMSEVSPLHLGNLGIAKFFGGAGLTLISKGRGK